MTPEDKNSIDAMRDVQEFLNEHKSAVFLLGPSFCFCSGYIKAVEVFKSSLREEITKIQEICTDDGEYKVLEQLKKNVENIIPNPIKQ